VNAPEEAREGSEALLKDEWLTIAQAARRLGVSDRTGRRYAARLADSDRQQADSGPVRVRLSALAAALKASPASGNPDTLAVPVADSLADNAGTGGGQMADSRLFEQMQADIAFLRSALEREQGNTQAANQATQDALARLAESEKRSQVLIAAAAQGRLNAPVGDEFSDTPTRAAEGEATAAKAEHNKGWWARLWRKN
jgi:ParB-like chromosome segregation protein Spo0J